MKANECEGVRDLTKMYFYLFEQKKNYGIDNVPFFKTVVL